MLASFGYWRDLSYLTRQNPLGWGLCQSMEQSEWKRCVHSRALSLWLVAMLQSPSDSLVLFFGSLPRHLLNEEQKDYFAKVAEYCKSSTELIPLSFVLGMVWMCMDILSRSYTHLNPVSLGSRPYLTVVSCLLALIRAGAWCAFAWKTPLIFWMWELALNRPGLGGRQGHNAANAMAQINCE